MLFKNLVIYRLHAGWDISAAALEQHLSRRQLQPCGALDMESRGWVPAGPEKRLVHTANGQHLIALGINQKVLPPSIVRQETEERAAEMEKALGSPVGRKQMREIRERVLVELRAKAFTRRRVSHAWIDTVNQWLVVDAAAVARAEEVIDTLRDSIESLPVTRFEAGSSEVQMAQWVRLGEAPLRLAVDTDLDLQASNEPRAAVKYARHSLDGTDIQEHLSAGKAVVRLGLTWNDRITFILTRKLEVKRVRFLSMEEEAGDGSCRLSAQDRFDQDFLLMSSELAHLVSDLAASLKSDAQHPPLAACA